MDSERIWGGFFVALILFGWFVWMISKIVARIFHDLGVMFDAIGTASMSLLGMAWALTQLIAVLSAGAAIAFAAYRYYQLVKEASDVLLSVDDRCNDWANHIEASQNELEKRLGDEVRFLRHTLAAALKKPEAVPELPKETTDTEAAPVVPEQIGKLDVNPTPVNESETTPRVSNPY